MNNQINVPLILTLHHNLIVNWKSNDIQLTHVGFLKLVEENHAFIYQLWHAEDNARRDDLGYEFVYRAKRAIDGFNQQRNNRMELMDAFLFEALSPSVAPTCIVHSETPGMMIDRLSILALKIYHMKLQTERDDVGIKHRETCLNKYETLLIQQKQLANCLEQFFLDIKDMKRTFRIYYQLKMYNDPALNPALYSAGQVSEKTS